MGIQYFQANNIATTLNGAINNSVTSITVTSSTGFPSTPFVAIIDTELVLVTNVSGTTWTVARGSESTTAAAHSNLAEVRQITTAAAWNALVQLQDTTPGTQQTGHIHISGAGQFGNTGLTASEAVLAINQSSTNATIDATNTSISGSALKAQNTSTTVAPIIGTNNGAGPGIKAVTNSGGIGFTASYSNTGNMAEFRNSGTGKGMLATSTSGNTVDATATTGSAGVFANSSTTVTTVQAANSSAGPVFQGTDGANTTTQLNTDGTANLYTSPNYVMNGDMLVNQRFGPAGTLAIATGAQNKYMVDRWHLDKDGTSQGTLSQIAFTVGQTDVPNEPQYYLDWNITTAGSGAAKNNIQHNIESVRTLAGKQVTFSIYMKVAASTQAVTLEIEQNFGSGGSASVLYTKGSTDTVTTTFQRFTYTVTLTGISGKTLGTAFTDSLIVRVKNPLNAAYQISYAHAQLELGPLATPFRVEDFGTTLTKCLRYYQKSFSYATVPAQNLGATGGMLLLSANTAGASAQALAAAFTFSGAMKISPAMTFYSPSAATAQAWNFTTGTACTSTSAAAETNEKMLAVLTTTPTGTAKGDLIGVQWSAEADY